MKHIKIISIAIAAVMLLEVLGLPIAPTCLKIIRGWLVIWPGPTHNFSDLVGNVAWPATALFIALLFYRPLTSRIGDLSELSWGDKKARFGKDLDRVLTQAEQSLPAQPAEAKLQLPQTAHQAEELVRFQEVVEVAPSLAVVDAWIPIERELQRIAVSKGYSGGRGRSVSFVLRRLRDDGVIDRALSRYIESLIRLRNEAVHGQSTITPEEAQRYREAAESALLRLKDVEGTPP